MPDEFLAIDHVQLAMPPRGEDAARAFYSGLLGMTEIPKPAQLAKRGGCLVPERKRSDPPGR